MKKDWKYLLERGLSVVSATILFWTVYFKLTAQPTSIELFSALCVEPWGRWTVGILESIAALVLLFRSVSFHGALLSFGIMGGAIIAHLSSLGVQYQGDYSLFILAVFVFVSSIVIMILRKEDILKFVEESKNMR